MNLHVAVNFTARKLFQIFVIKCQPVSRFSYDPISISYLHVAVNFTPEIVRIIWHYTKNSYLESKVVQKLQKLYA